MEETISERLERLERSTLEAKNIPPKTFKLPIAANLQRGKVLKKNWVHVMMIHTNGSFEVKTLPIEENTVRFGDYFYDARGNNILRYKGMPCLVLKEWNISPEAPPEEHSLDMEADYKAASKSGRLTMPQKLIVTKMRMEAIKPKMQLNMGVVIMGLVLIGGGYFILSSLGMV